MTDFHPLISCICITDNRPLLLKRSINCFLSQNYSNKELVICYPENDRDTHSIVYELSKIKESQILGIERPKDTSVGNARNLAISKCRGDYVCVWDDDDWYHESRLSFQYNSMQTIGKGYYASVLRRVILFDSNTQKAYLSFLYSWENTLMCRKEIISQNQYANQNKGEDTHIVKFLDTKKFLHYIDEAPFLYIYIYHGENTWDYKHYMHLINQSLLLEKDITDSIYNLLSS